MRLLNVRSLTFQEFHGHDAPPFITTSHRWLADETTLQKVEKRVDTDCAGYQKIQGFCNVARRSQQCDWIWVDTCCINKESSAEVAESINSMFAWYKQGDYCYAYMADVRPLSAGYDAVLTDFAQSEWFQRGWTLQELLAPRCVIFLTQQWEVMGHKCRTGGDTRNCTGCAQALNTKLNSKLAQVTGLPEDVLWDYDNSTNLLPKQKWTWTANRRTTKPEDMAYCLLGIFGVYMPLIYGEGAENAKKRLQQEITKVNNRPNPGARRGDFGDDVFNQMFFKPQKMNMEMKMPSWMLKDRSLSQSEENSSNFFGKSSGFSPAPSASQFFDSDRKDSKTESKNADRVVPGPRQRAGHKRALHTARPGPAGLSPAQSAAAGDYLPNTNPQALARLSTAQIAAAGKHLPSIDLQALAALSPAQIIAAGDHLPAVDITKLSLLTSAQIRAAGDFLPVWNIQDLASKTAAEIRRRRRLCEEGLIT